VSFYTDVVKKFMLMADDAKCALYAVPLQTFLNFKAKHNLFPRSIHKANVSLDRKYVTFRYQAPRTSFNFWQPAICFFIMDSYKSSFTYNLTPIHRLQALLKTWSIYFLDLWKRTIGEGAYYLRGLFIIFFIDALLTDDEPIWEPVEWSLVQSWIMFIFFFAWVAENLITSRFGSYTGRDKRVWFSWYKTFWWINFYYLITMAVAALFVITPFYNELTYTLPFIVSWWNWYNRIFFCKFLSLYVIVLLLAYFLQIGMRWYNWRKALVLILLINFFLSYLVYTHFFMSFFGYFTDPNWYHKTRLVDYVQLSHEPNKWSWGSSKRDHFSYHKSSTVFWFKNDGPFAGAFLFFHLFFFMFLFLFFMYWIILIRRVYVTQEITYTYTTYCISGLKQFFYFFLALYGFVFLSFFFNYWRFPVEFLWILTPDSWLLNFSHIIADYAIFILSLLY